MTATLDGEDWEQPEAIAAVSKLIPTLPHLTGALVAFFRGALATWERFTTEFAIDSTIANASQSDCERAWMKPTNDDNEGALGERRQRWRRAPNMTQEQHNARAMYRKNHTAAFIKRCLASPESQAFLKKRARWNEGRGLEKRRREAQAAAYLTAVRKGRQTDARRKKRQEKKKEKLATVVPCTLDDVEGLEKEPGKWSVKMLDLQLEWYREQDKDKQMPLRKNTKVKQLKIDALIGAIRRRFCGIPETGGDLDDVGVEIVGSEEFVDHDSDMATDGESDLEFDA